MHSSLMPHVLSNPFLYKLSSSRLLRVLGLSSHIATPNSGPQMVIMNEDELEGGGALDADVYDEFLQMSRVVVDRLDLSTGAGALVINGRVVRPVLPGEFEAADFKLLQDIEMKRGFMDYIESRYLVGRRFIL
ncbi:hypothetical protein JAAARDRAFT_402296 [Jaapia argillacea MUCL 33604]|uniref:UDP-glucose:glycoprotein glucosyltransferase thioredoxin-like domain-containing protein n=1 Tax=Jaapia argillacea MUCL 33604 TaxID=933084 RepID=A0A067P2H9_9AGAM|nr:hypothetical protein JAAARDRAFT_402296 [Jaapia argillacea MUCL 33604]